ncbi:MAG: dihydrofolate reductase family protein, partial [Chloroflexota bacterium]
MVQIEKILGDAEKFRKKHNRPFVTLTYAQSLDGSIALENSQSTPISGEASLEMTHQLRANHDALLVGIGTILADNPRLTT